VSVVAYVLVHLFECVRMFAANGLFFTVTWKFQRKIVVSFFGSVIVANNSLMHYYYYFIIVW